MSDIKILRLKTGEDLIGSIKTTMDRSYIISKPHIVFYDVSSGKVGLFPFLVYADTSKGIEIAMSDTMWILDPDKDLTAAFTKSTTNIIVPSVPSGLKLSS